MLLFSDVLYMLVRYASQSGPMCLRCLMLTLSGPVELLFLHCVISAWTSVVVSVKLSSSSSCHQTVVFHLSMQDIAGSLNFERSSKVQDRARRVHCSMCAVFSVARPHSHVVCSSKYFHFFRCSLLHV